MRFVDDQNRLLFGLAADVPHPLHLAGALEVLAVELQEELHGQNAGEALTLLRRELGFTVGQARSWAAKRDLLFDFPIADADCTAEECILLLRSLADVLRELATRAALRAMNDNAALDDEDD